MVAPQLQRLAHLGVGAEVLARPAEAIVCGRGDAHLHACCLAPKVFVFTCPELVAVAGFTAPSCTHRKRYWHQLDDDVTVHNVQCYGGITTAVRERTVGGQQGEQQVQRQLQGLQQCAHVTGRHSGLHVQRW